MNIHTAPRYSVTPQAQAKLGPGHWAMIEIQTDTGILRLSDPCGPDDGLEIETRRDGRFPVYVRIDDETGSIVEIRIPVFTA